MAMRASAKNSATPGAELFSRLQGVAQLPVPGSVLAIQRLLWRLVLAQQR
jgi:hypothetical protein